MFCQQKESPKPKFSQEQYQLSSDFQNFRKGTKILIVGMIFGLLVISGDLRRVLNIEEHLSKDFHLPTNPFKRPPMEKRMDQRVSMWRDIGVDEDFDDLHRVRKLKFTKEELERGAK